MCSIAAEVDLDGLSDGELLDRVRELSALQNRVAAELTRTVRKAEVRQSCEHDGLKSMASWLKSHTRMSGGEASQLLRQGRALAHLPAVQTAFAAGQLTADAVDVLAE